VEFLISFDKGVFFAFDNTVTPEFGKWLNPVMIRITHLGDLWILCIVVLAGVAVLAVFRRLRSAILMTATFLLAIGLNDGTKELVGRDRPAPTNPVIHVPHSYSFPSGHALESAATYGTLALLAARGLKSRGARALLIGGSLVLVGLIGFSRVYLCVHYVSDVIGGWAAGWALALACAWLDERWQAALHKDKDVLAP
jgi:undecaprenyl-diphosphatase